jgi:transposase-like protein
VTEQQLLGMAKRRLAVLRHAGEITGNVALTCRYYGISRQVFYTLRRRYDERGLDGLRDRSRRPRVSDRMPATVVVRSVPGLTVRCGMRVARPANDVGSAWQRWAPA